MAFTGFGPDITFLGVPRCELDDVSTYADADIVILGAPLDGGTNYRSGTGSVHRPCARPATSHRMAPVPAWRCASTASRSFGCMTPATSSSTTGTSSRPWS
jgi:hypothetical protein